MDKSIRYDWISDTVIKDSARLKDYITALENSGHVFHHRSIRAGYVSKSSAGFVRDYNGKFGEGKIIATYKGEKTVFCTYYINYRRSI